VSIVQVARKMNANRDLGKSSRRSRLARNVDSKWKLGIAEFTDHRSAQQR
jgi:hypothetical protein